MRQERQGLDPNLPMRASSKLNSRFISERLYPILVHYCLQTKRLFYRLYGTLSAFGIPLNANDRRLAAFKDIHKGQRAFIIGTGPSLHINDLDRLKGEITYACNKIYLAFDETDWRPTYYTLLDVLVAKNNYDSINKLDLCKVFSNEVKSSFRNTQDILWLRDLGHPVQNGETGVRFSTNALVGVYGGWTVIHTMLQLAFYMGITEVFIIGLDFEFHVSKPTGEISAHGDVVEQKDEVNHFHPKYREPGEKWTIPKLELQRRAYSCARKAFESNGRNIYNASRKTALDVFPLVDFDKILSVP